MTRTTTTTAKLPTRAPYGEDRERIVWTDPDDDAQEIEAIVLRPRRQPGKSRRAFYRDRFNIVIRGPVDARAKRTVWTPWAQIRRCLHAAARDQLTVLATVESLDLDWRTPGEIRRADAARAEIARAEALRDARLWQYAQLAATTGTRWRPHDGWLASVARNAHRSACGYHLCDGDTHGFVYVPGCARYLVRVPRAVPGSVNLISQFTAARVETIDGDFVTPPPAPVKD